MSAARSTGTSPRRGRRTAATLLAGLAGLAGLALVGVTACGSDEHTAADPHEHPAETTASTSASTTTEAPVSATGPFEITAKEFAFEGVPSQVDAGTHTFTFTNDGAEPHELLIFRNTEGLSLDEIAALGPVESKQHIQVAGMVVAAPGGSAEAPIQVDLTPGEWEVVCFIPSPTDGQAHSAHGMHTTITVV